MSTKTEIDTAILTMTTGGNNPASVLRAALDVVKEGFYKDILNDSSIDETYTSANSYFSYNIKISKSGRFGLIEGKIRALANTSDGVSTILFEIGESFAEGLGTGSAENSVSNISFPIFMSGSSLTTRTSVLTGQVFSINILYNLTN